MTVNGIAAPRPERRESSSAKTRKMVTMALLTAVVVVLTLIATFVKIGPFPLTLTLIPIVVGASVVGAGAGAFLGGVFGVVVLIACISGADPGGFVLWTTSPFLTALLCLAKGVLAGWCAGLVYSAFAGRKRFFGYSLTEIQPEGLAKKIIAIRTYLGVILAAIACPVVNTGVFCLGMFLCFKDMLIAGAGGSSIFVYLIVVMVGVNFLIELGINLILSPVVLRLTRIRKK